MCFSFSFVNFVQRKSHSHKYQTDCRYICCFVWDRSWLVLYETRYEWVRTSEQTSVCVCVCAFVRILHMIEVTDLISFFGKHRIRECVVKLMCVSFFSALCCVSCCVFFSLIIRWSVVHGSNMLIAELAISRYYTTIRYKRSVHI